MSSLNFLGSLVLPINSLNNKSKSSDTEAPTPMWPLAKANKEAVVMFLIWVITERTVLLICVAALIPNKLLIMGNLSRPSIITEVSVMALPISGKATIGALTVFPLGPLTLLTNKSSMSML